jgi:ADP-heptose:LPS heptosyltransferase
MFGSLAITGGQIDAFDFRLSSGDFGPNLIFDSATSPPGRYILEVALRTIEAAPDCDAVVVANPILPFTGARLADLVLEGGTLPIPCVIGDSGTFPVAYALPRSLFDRGLGRFLNLLSVTKRAMDALLLGHLTGTEVPKPASGLKAIGDLPPASPQGFIFRENPQAWAVQCLGALDIMSARSDWAGLPFAAHHPNHAGDVMFFSLASRINRRLDYDRQVVCRPYLDIFHECGNRLEPIVLDMPPVSRDGKVSDARYFIDSLPHLGGKVLSETFVVYSRFSKSYPQTPFNLIDHARFSLGDSIRSFADTLYARAPVVANRCVRPAAPLRVLLQLNGGWPMKTYPAADRRVLVRALRALGCAVTVLDLEDAAEDGAEIARAGSTETLKALLNDHHVFVSVDSFPLHYASQIVGHPTVALFGVTSPGNSDAPRGAGYRLPQPLMPCGGCGSYQVCPLTYQPFCGNYPRPGEVVAAVFEVAAEIYGVRQAERAA